MKPAPITLKSETLGGRIAVLMGGTAAEREISLNSGRAVLNALLEQGIDAFAIDTSENLMATLKTEAPAFAFIAVHGRGGEDGVLQATLENLGVPYSGSGVLGSALAMDKARAKALWKGVGVSTADFRQIDESFESHSGKKLEELFGLFDGPVFVKPAKEGSSFGLGVAKNAQELREAIDNASQFDRHILLEQYINGPEYTVGILDSVELPSICIETQREFYNYAAKYQDDDTYFGLPSGLNDDEEQEIQQLARLAFDELGCAGWGRVDVMRDKASGRFYVLEVNTVPGMTDHSLVPKAAQAAGISFPELIIRIIDSALSS